VNPMGVMNLRKRLQRLEAPNPGDPSGCLLYSPGWFHYWEQKIYRVFVAKTEPAERGCLTIEAYRAILVARADHAGEEPSEERPNLSC